MAWHKKDNAKSVAVGYKTEEDARRAASDLIRMSDAIQVTLVERKVNDRS